ncbi:Threonine dehydratase biosynthetic, chloroplastic [Nymphon striatum]|nr:Threonine dehydratase biosynthetic, chloroplastic [Nymphon striatum]
MIPVGGGGLIAGIALAVKSLNPNIKIYGVESERCASFTAAMKAGQAVYTTASTTLADGLAVPTVGVNAYKTAAPFIDKMIVTGHKKLSYFSGCRCDRKKSKSRNMEEDIAIAILRLVEMEKAVVEGAGAAALAACLAGQVPELEGKRIKDIVHERAWLMQDIFSVSVSIPKIFTMKTAIPPKVPVAVVCETKDKEHAYQLEQLLRQKYDQVQFIGLSEPSYVRPKIETESVKAVVKGGKPVPMAGARRKHNSRYAESDKPGSQAKF